MSEQHRGARFFELINKHRSDEILLICFVQLKEYLTIIRCSRVCKFWNYVSRQNSLWSELCKTLWSNKVYVPEQFRLLHESGRSKEAFKHSMLDSERTAITKEELTSLLFYFRFKEVAGSYWTDQDPFWQKQEPLKISFTQAGTLVGFPWDVLEAKWRFVDKTGRTCQNKGSFIRVSVNERSVPTYMVSRHSNWGFIMQVQHGIIQLPSTPLQLNLCSQNCWVVYFSFPMPPIGAELSLDDRFFVAHQPFRFPLPMPVAQQKSPSTCVIALRYASSPDYPAREPAVRILSCQARSCRSASLPPPAQRRVVIHPFPAPPCPPPPSRALDELMDDERWGEALAYNSGIPMPYENE